MKRKPIRTAILGYGKVAHVHAQALAALPMADFAAVCGRDPEKARLFAARYGVRAYTDIGEMARDAGIEAVVVCTPHPAHAEGAVQAARAGLHVLVEKPLATTLADCDAILSAARESRVVLGTVSQRRFYPSVRRVKAAIEAGKIGRPVLGLLTMLGWRDEAYYRSDPWRGSWAGEGGGVLVNQAPHQVDLLQWFMGPVEEVYGCQGNLNHPYIEVEDTAVAVIRFRGGGFASLVASNAQNPALYGQVHVFGDNGAGVGVRTDKGAMFIAGMTTITEPPVNDLWTVPGEAGRLEEWQREDAVLFRSIDPIQHFHERQLEDFLEAVAHGTRPLVDGEEGRKTVAIIEAIYRSSQERRPVRFD